ncbi:hypothetical protein RCO28_17235 [Streptomyces sp. LHD-70]|uniref:hypothetical protein n=1 Tax=Streptomyces sp. LHD-70 TaxID=3072140 RepID=UPI0028101A9A|nr:hypothetical protein [Streptomyces sp. LHD-70]MDQ8704218.1 hypothetical protein [Streptomyces sp. LHD-70]
MTPTDPAGSPSENGASSENGAPDWPPAADRAVRAVLAIVLAFLTVAIMVVVPLLAIACGTCRDGVRTPGFPGVLTALTSYVVPAVGVVSVLGVCTARRSGVAMAVGGGALAGLAALILLAGRLPG